MEGYIHTTLLTVFILVERIREVVREMINIFLYIPVFSDLFKLVIYYVYNLEIGKSFLKLKLLVTQFYLVLVSH